MPAGQNSSQLKREPAIVVLNLTYQPGVQLWNGGSVLH
jgi:hypothetical protein